LPFAYVIRAWMARDQKHNQDTLIVIELSKWACLATQKEEKYKFISKQVLLIDKHKHIKRGKSLVILITKRNYTVIEIYASF